MKILITGGAGFLGQRLARALLARDARVGIDGRRHRISELVLLDVVPAAGPADSRVVVKVGDIADRQVLDDTICARTQIIFHLAAIVSGQAEADFGLGMRINLDASRRLLDAAAARAHKPRIVFTSSVAVYGGTMPAVVQDDTALQPGSSYGAQKAIAELLLCDYTRRGLVDGRVLRLPTISVRPGRPNAAASSFASGIIREPLAGQPAICPVAPQTRLWLLSPRRAVDALIAGAELEAAAFDGRPIVNLPGLSVSVADMVDALRDVAGADVANRIEWRPDPHIENIVCGWPAAWDTTRALRLGFAGDRDFADVVRAHIDDAALVMR